MLIIRYFFNNVKKNFKKNILPQKNIEKQKDDNFL